MASPPREVERPKNVAKWGAACAPCASAKAKCLRSNSSPGAKCDRCDRLFKDCVSQTHRPRKKRTSKPSRTAQLEQRLNGLVELLRASGDLSNLSLAIPDEIPEDKVESTFRAVTCISNDTDLDVVDLQQRNPSPSSPTDSLGQDDLDSLLVIPSTYNCNAPESCICRPQSGEAPPPPESDEILLSIYQTHLTHQFPFVIVPQSTTPVELQAKKPFLMAAIRMVTSLTSMRSMRAQMYRLMHHLTEHMLMRSERSMDLLQGIIVIIGWYHYHCLMHAQMNNLIHLATSLTADLGLNKHPMLAEKTSVMVLYPDEPSPRSNEERRALLAVWYITSCIAQGFGRIESLKYTAYIQQCLRELEQAREYESDAVLVHMVRLQHLSEDITEINSREDDENEEVSGVPKAPVSAYISAFQKELDKIRNSLTKPMRNNKYLMASIHTATLRLYEPPIIDAALLKKFQRDLTNVRPNSTSALDCFYRANGALRTWFEHWLNNIPVSSYFYLPMTACCHIIYGVTMLSRWSKLISPIKTRPLAGPGTAASVSLDDPHSCIKPDNEIPTSSALRRAGTTPFSSGNNSFGAGLAPAPDFGSLAPASSNANGGGAASARCSPPISTSATSPSGTHSTNTSIATPPTGTQSATVRPPPGPLASVRWRTTADPVIPSIVAALKEQLLSQPGLSIDIAEILGELGARFEQASREMREASRGDEVTEPNIWDLSAKKAMITRAKLERWAEIVAEGDPSQSGAGTGLETDGAAGVSPEGMAGVETSAAANGSYAGGGRMMDDSAAVGGGFGLPVQLEGIGLALDGAGGGQGQGDALDASHEGEMGCVPGAFEAWQGNNLWSTDLFAGLDPNMWTDAGVDWGSASGLALADRDFLRGNMNGGR